MGCGSSVIAPHPAICDRRPRYRRCLRMADGTYLFRERASVAGAIVCFSPTTMPTQRDAITQVLESLGHHVTVYTPEQARKFSHCDECYPSPSPIKGLCRRPCQMIVVDFRLGRKQSADRITRYILNSAFIPVLTQPIVLIRYEPWDEKAVYAYTTVNTGRVHGIIPAHNFTADHIARCMRAVGPSYTVKVLPPKQRQEQQTLPTKPRLPPIQGTPQPPHNSLLLHSLRSPRHTLEDDHPPEDGDTTDNFGSHYDLGSRWRQGSRCSTFNSPLRDYTISLAQLRHSNSTINTPTPRNSFLSFPLPLQPTCDIWRLPKPLGVMGVINISRPHAHKNMEPAKPRRSSSLTHAHPHEDFENNLNRTSISSIHALQA